MSKSKINQSSGVSGSKGDAYLPPRVPPPSPQRWAMGFAATTAPFADPARVNVMLQALAPLLVAGASVRFSNHTGLVRTLRGRLWQPQVSNLDQAFGEADAFLHQHQMALFGNDQNHWIPAERRLVGAAACFRQVAPDGIPVYGAIVACDYDSTGRLRMLTSNWYPLPPKDGARDRFRISLERAFEAARAAVEALLIEELKQLTRENRADDLSFYERAISELVVIPGTALEEGRVLAPLHRVRHGADADLPPEPGYWAAWVVRVLDRVLHRSWEVLVDAEDAAAEVLGVGLVTRELNVFLINAAAASQQPINSIDLPAVQPPLDTTNQRQANVYFHLTHAAQIFEASTRAAWPGPVSAIELLPGRLNGRPLTITIGGPGTGAYDPGDIRNPTDATILFGLGSNDPPVRNPAFDREVVFHEYTHALIDIFQPDIVDKNQPEPFRRALDEGLAFYFGCTLSERQPAGPAPAYRWGDFAYNDRKWTLGATRDLERSAGQAAGFDYLQTYGVFPHYTALNQGEPTKESHYACGMVWSRALWDVRRVLGFANADAAILRGLPLISGIQTELETAAEAIIHADEVLAPTPADIHENALRLIFCSRGIMADAPVHTLRVVSLGAQTCLLAAIERPPSGQSGCLISLDDGDSWVPLGNAGPAEVCALTVVEHGAGSATVVAAAEALPPGGPTFHRYELQLANGAVDLGRNWNALPAGGPAAALLSQAGILVLAAMSQPGVANGALWVFAGTENGLYRHDGTGWSQVLPGLVAEPIRSLALMGFTQLGGAPAKVLLATGRLGTFAISPDGLGLLPQFASQALPADETLAVAISSAGAGAPDHAWIGSWNGRLFHFDPAAPAAPAAPNGTWKALPAMPQQRPVYQLLADHSGVAPVLFAGTNDGVWRLPITQPASVWEQLAGAGDASFDGSAVVALGQVGMRLLAGTLQRGIWRGNGAVGATWERLTNGLARIGRLADAEAPAAGAWHRQFIRNQQLLQDAAVAHVVAVPAARASLTANLATNGGVANLTIYYVAPYISVPKFAAGLTLKVPNAGAVAPAAPGYYLLVVTATQPLGGYTLDVDLA